MKVVKRRFSGKDYFAGLTGVHNGRPYLILSGGDVTNRIIGSGIPGKDRRFAFVSIDFAPHTIMMCKRRFIDSINRASTIEETYGLLRQFLADNDIREFYYELWRLHKNTIATRMREKIPVRMRRR